MKINQTKYNIIQNNNNFLNEKLLGLYVKYIFEEKLGYEVIHNKKLPNIKELYRPDYRIEKIKLIIEFDGYQHFTNNKNIITDQIKDELYEKLGYRVIRIPYFIQLSHDVLERLFNDYILDDIVIDLHKIRSKYPQGFIDDKCVLPCEFTELGFKLFNKYIDLFDVREDVYSSLKIKGLNFNKKFVYFYEDVKLKE